MGLSVKQGRIPSLAGAIFGIFWTIGVISMMIFIISTFGGEEGMGGFAMVPFIVIPGIMVIGGIIMVASGFYNAFAKNRISSIDIMSQEEEPDPGRFLVYNEHDGDRDPSVLVPPPNSSKNRTDAPDEEGGFCPYCGAKANADYEFCRKCGKDI